MSSEWRSIAFGDFVALQRGHDLPDQERRPGNVPILGSFGVTGFHDTVKANGPGVTIGRSGASFGVAAYTDNDYWPLNTALYVTNFKGNDPKFVFYFFKEFDFSGYNSGSAQPSLNRNNLYDIPVRIPQPSVQKQIAGFVSALDDRIALLRETNATLEAIAQALFKSWFVDFDPVHAKQQGRTPEGMDEATAALFPDSFEESELGLIPKGWSISHIEDTAEKVGMGPFGSNIKVSTFVSQGVPVLNGRNVQDTLLTDLDFNFITPSHAEKLKNSCVKAGDVVITHRGTLGQVALVPEGLRYDQFVVSQSQFFLRCDRQRMVPEWITYFFKSPIGQQLLLANTSQVGVPSIARPVSHLRSIKLVLPPFGILSRFSETVSALHKSVVANRQQAQTLATLRDTLLPRLISGQLRLPEASSVS